jgi:hypothetical protein
VLRQVNTTRTGLAGVNRKPIPSGQVTTHPDGRISVAADSRHYDLRSNGTLASFNGRNEQARFRPDGRIASVHTATMDVTRGVHGERTVVIHRPDGAVVVRSGPNQGYVQRTVVYNRVSYVQRTYVVGPRVYTRVYTTYAYHGVMLEHYVPGVYYAPAFYSWGYYPWAAPVPYAWPWMAEPWYGFYGSYFTAWPLYPSPAYWLTDFYLGQIMASAYQAQMQAQQAAQDEAAQDYVADGSEQAAGDPVYAEANTPITPELKQAIAEEVRSQLAYENAASQKPTESAKLSGLPEVLQPNHIFVVDAGLNVMTDQGPCQLSPGDVLRLAEAPAEDSTTANLKVASGRRGDCPAGALATVSLEQLQEMQNSLRAQLDSGLKALHDGQGRNGLPAAPPSAIAPPPRPVDDLPPAQQDAQALVQSAGNEADRTENRITLAAFAPGDQTAGAKY